MPSPTGAFRGPLSTAGVDDLRGGAFRAEHAAFRFDIGNDGWRSTTGAPDTTVAEAVRRQHLFGEKLRGHLASNLSRQIRFSHQRAAILTLSDLGHRATHIDVEKIRTLRFRHLRSSSHNIRLVPE